MSEIKIPPDLLPQNKIIYYEFQYDVISALLTKIDPCEIRSVDGIVQCEGIRAGDADADTGTLCCTGCLHLGGSGCKAKALGCKMWLCSAAIKNLFSKFAQMPEDVVSLIKEIQETNRACEFYGIPCRSRHSMRENMDGVLNENGFKMSKTSTHL